MSTKVVIEDVKLANHGKKLEPIMVKFSHCENLLERKEMNVKTGLFLDSLGQKEFVAISQVGSMCYMGNTEEQSTQGGHKSYLAIKKKFSNKVTLVEISKVFLKPTIEYPSTTNPVLLATKSNSKEAKEQLAKDFIHRFGMLKGQRAYDQALRLNVQAETVRATLENAALNTTIEEKEVSLPNISESYEMMLPSRNPQAKLASDVYCLEDLISVSDMMALRETGEILLKTEYSEIISTSESFTPYFSKTLLTLKSNENIDNDLKLRYFAALAYMEGLLKMATIPSKTLSRNRLDNSLPSFLPQEVKVSIRNKFASGEGPSWKNSQFLKDKTICHILAIGFAIENCIIEAEKLTRSLKIDLDVLGKLVQVVGARIVKPKENADTIIVLSLPLAVPSRRRVQKRKVK